MQREYKRKIELDFKIAEMGDIRLVPWQFELFKKLTREPDERKLTWYYDPRGRSGKTYVSMYLQAKRALDCIRFENAKSETSSSLTTGSASSFSILAGPMKTASTTT